MFRAGAKRSHDAAEVFDGVHSMHDRKAAWVLTRLHETGATQPWGLATEEQRTLRALHDHWRLCEGEHMRYMGRIEGVMARHWPGIAEFLKLSGLTLPCLLMEFGGPTGVAATPEAAGALMRRVGGSQLREEKIEAVLRSAEAQAARMAEQGVELVPAEEAFIKRVAQGAQQSRNEALKARKELEKHVPEPCEALRQLVGPALTVGLLGSGSDPRQMASPRSFEKALGLNLKVFSSGERKVGGLHISKRGDGQLRHLLFLAAELRLRRPPNGGTRAGALSHRRERRGARLVPTQGRTRSRQGEGQGHHRRDAQARPRPLARRPRPAIRSREAVRHPTTQAGKATWPLRWPPRSPSAEHGRLDECVS